MKHELPGGQERKFPHVIWQDFKLFSYLLMRPPNESRNYLFLNPVFRPALKVTNPLDTTDISGKNRITAKIKKKFRINLIKPCKSLKKVISYCPDIAKRSKRSTRQYQGFRYSVSPEMEFGHNELILGRLNVKQFASKQARCDG
jgi:hypothetical protein